MVVIRLARFGNKGRPNYRITVADSRRHATKKFLEIVGAYNPQAKDAAKKCQIDMDRVNFWVGRGAQPTDRVKHLIKQLQSGPA